MNNSISHDVVILASEPDPMLRSTLNFIQKALFSTWVHGLRTHDDDKIRNSLQPKSISQAQIENLLKCMKILAFCRQKVMQNHGIGISTQW